MNLSKVNIWIDAILTDNTTKLSETSKGRLELLKNEVNKSNRLEKLVSQPSVPTFGQWNKPEDLPENLISYGLDTIRLIVKYKIRNKIFVDFGHKTKYDWRVSGSPSSWNDEILGWMPLPKP